jgi:hypothetical protein
MLPDNVASSTRLPGDYLPPDQIGNDPLQDFELAGIALNDPSQGLQARVWRCYYAGTQDVMIEPAGGDATLVFTLAGITRLALAFDQNMRPHIAYTKDGEGFLRWYDPVPQAFVTTNFGAIRDLRLSLDDKRAFADNTSDIILAYLSGTGLFYRQQRDRFQTERQLASNLPATSRLRRVGMGRGLRMQFDVT